MIRAYRIVHEDDAVTVYQYNAACGIWLYASAALLLVGVIFESVWLTRISLGLLTPYMVFVYFPAILDGHRIRAEMARGGVEISGRRFSFSNPLRIRVPRRPGG